MKNLEYYLGLPYRIEIRPISEDKGGGYEASIPQLGRYAICGDGDSAEEALRNLDTIKKERLAAYLEEGLPIPEPEPDEAEYSGKFIVRIPKSLHMELALKAKQNNVSLNQYVGSLLAGGLQADKFHSALADFAQDIKDLRQQLSDLCDSADEKPAAGTISNYA